MKKALQIIALLVAGTIAAGPAVAEKGVLREKKKLSAIEKKLSAEKKKVKAIVRKETSILAGINRINRDLYKKKKKIKKVKRAIKRIKRKIFLSGKGIRRLQRKRKKILAKLSRRLRAMYKLRSGRILNVAFATEGAEAASFGRRIRYMTVIAKADAALLSEADANLKGLLKEKEKLSDLKKGLERTRRKLASEKRAAESLRADRLALLVTVRERKDARLKLVRELERAAEELSSLIKDLSAGRDRSYSGFSAMKGKLIMPVEGRIVSRFGKVMHPKFKTITFNKGIIIDAPSGRPVRSVYRGRIVYTGWLKGYGQLVIIDHGGGFYTLFAHLAKILKGRGEVVEKGEEVALVGDTGPWATTGLYFEIRKKGKPEDPMKWLAAR